MTALILAIGLTLSVSAFCSLLEAFILSTTTAETEALKRTHPRLGPMLERFRAEIAETSSAILTLNTIANTMGASLIGWLASNLLEDRMVGFLMGGLVLGILFLSEILPKNLGVIHRRTLQPILVYPLHLVRIVMWPFSYFAKKSVRWVFASEPSVSDEEKDQEIILLAEKSAEEGALSPNERDMISNALSLDTISVHEIMTPRTVVLAMDETRTVDQTCREYRSIPFGRIPVYRESIDEITGLVRRRDILQAYAEDKEHLTLAEIATEAVFIPDTATALAALQTFLLKHQQFAVVVDEYGSTAGVLTMEDVIEHLLGREIYEDSDVAVDMRELARRNATRPPPAPEPGPARGSGPPI